MRILCLTIGLVAGQYLIIILRLREHASEYVKLALKRSFLLLVFLFLVRLGIGVLVIRFAWELLPGGLTRGPTAQIAVSFLLGVFLAAGVEGFLASSVAPAGLDGLTRPLFKLMKMFGLIAVQPVERRIQDEMARDNHRWQQRRDQWAFDVPSNEVGRRIRKLYEVHKKRIAVRHKNPRLLRNDVHQFPGGKFYNLVKLLGPTELRLALSQPVEEPSADWAGNERRRRLNERLYDDISKILRVKKGEEID